MPERATCVFLSYSFDAFSVRSSLYWFYLQRSDELSLATAVYRSYFKIEISQFYSQNVWHATQPRLTTNGDNDTSNGNRVTNTSPLDIYCDTTRTRQWEEETTTTETTTTTTTTQMMKMPTTRKFVGYLRFKVTLNTWAWLENHEPKKNHKLLPHGFNWYLTNLRHHQQTQRVIWDALLRFVTEVDWLNWIRYMNIYQNLNRRQCIKWRDNIRIRHSVWSIECKGWTIARKWAVLSETLTHTKHTHTTKWE